MATTLQAKLGNIEERLENINIDPKSDIPPAFEEDVRLPACKLRFLEEVFTCANGQFAEAMWNDESSGDISTGIALIIQDIRLSLDKFEEKMDRALGFEENAA